MHKLAAHSKSEAMHLPGCVDTRIKYRGCLGWMPILVLQARDGKNLCQSFSNAERDESKNLQIVRKGLVHASITSGAGTFPENVLQGPG